MLEDTELPLSEHIRLLRQQRQNEAEQERHALAVVPSEQTEVARSNRKRMSKLRKSGNSRATDLSQPKSPYLSSKTSPSRGRPIGGKRVSYVPLSTNSGTKRRSSKAIPTRRMSQDLRDQYKQDFIRALWEDNHIGLAQNAAPKGSSSQNEDRSFRRQNGAQSKKMTCLPHVWVDGGHKDRRYVQDSDDTPRAYIEHDSNDKYSREVAAITRRIQQNHLGKRGLGSSGTPSTTSSEGSGEDLEENSRYLKEELDQFLQAGNNDSFEFPQEGDQDSFRKSSTSKPRGGALRVITQLNEEKEKRISENQEKKSPASTESRQYESAITKPEFKKFPELGSIFDRLGEIDFSLTDPSRLPTGAAPSPKFADLRRELEDELKLRKSNKATEDSAIIVQKTYRGYKGRATAAYLKGYMNQWHEIWDPETQAEYAQRQPRNAPWEAATGLPMSETPEYKSFEKDLRFPKRAEQVDDFYFAQQEVVNLVKPDMSSVGKTELETHEGKAVPEVQNATEGGQSIPPSRQEDSQTAPKNENKVTVQSPTHEQPVVAPTVEPQQQYYNYDYSNYYADQAYNQQAWDHYNYGHAQQQYSPHGNLGVAVQQGQEIAQQQSWGEIAFGQEQAHSPTALAQPVQHESTVAAVPLSPAKTPKSVSGIHNAVEALEGSGYTCLQAVQDFVPLLNTNIKMVRSNGTIDTVKLLEVMWGEEKVRCEMNGTVVVKKTKYCFCDLSSVAEKEDEPQRTHRSSPKSMQQSSIGKSFADDEDDDDDDEDEDDEDDEDDVIENVLFRKGDWEVCFDQKARKFYYNTKTGKSRWTMPKELKGQNL